MTVRRDPEDGRSAPAARRPAGRALRHAPSCTRSSPTCSRPCMRSTAPAWPRRRSASTWQLVIFGFSRNQRYPDAPPVPETVLINPTITPLGDDEEEGWEGCLSVPGLRGVVPRFARIRYTRLRRRRPADRARGRRLSRPRRPARVRSPGRQALPDADPRLQPLRLHQRAVSRARRREPTTERPRVAAGDALARGDRL